MLDIEEIIDSLRRFTVREAVSKAFKTAGFKTFAEKYGALASDRAGAEAGRRFRSRLEKLSAEAVEAGWIAAFDGEYGKELGDYLEEYASSGAPAQFLREFCLAVFSGTPRDAARRRFKADFNRLVSDLFTLGYEVAWAE